MTETMSDVLVDYSLKEPVKYTNARVRVHSSLGFVSILHDDGKRWINIPMGRILCITTKGRDIAMMPTERGGDEDY